MWYQKMPTEFCIQSSSQILKLHVNRTSDLWLTYLELDISSWRERVRVASWVLLSFTEFNEYIFIGCICWVIDIISFKKNNAWAQMTFRCGLDIGSTCEQLVHMTLQLIKKNTCAKWFRKPYTNDEATARASYGYENIIVLFDIYLAPT